MSARHPTRREAAAAAGLALAAAVAPHRRATAQTPQAAWPARPIRVIVPYAPGGTADTTARALGHAMTPRLGQPVVVENRSGATGAIGMEAAARAAPDGHTLVVAADAAIYQPYLRPSLPYHPLRDLAPVSVLVQQPIVVAAHPGLGVRTLAELVALARARPGEVAYVTSGTASTHHLAAELLCRRAGIRMTHVPYRGGGQAINDLVAGQVGLGVLGSGPVVPHARAGRLRLLAVTPAARSPGLPEVPTVAEQGFPGYDLPQWFGMLAPAGTPAEVVARVQAEAAAALALPEVRRVLGDLALDPVGGTPEACRARIEAEAAVWAEAARALGTAEG